MEKTALWAPTDSQIASSQMTAFQHFIERNYGITFESYKDLKEWSINNTAFFWQEIWDFCEIKCQKLPNDTIREPELFPGAQWFPGSQLNFAENMLRNRDEQPAIISLQENGNRTTLSYNQLHRAVTKLAAAMRSSGIKKGDRVVGFMPNISETVIAMLATTSLGAIWSSCSPDFGVAGACDRFGQIKPRLLFATTRYQYNGKTIECLEKVKAIQLALKSLDLTVVVSAEDGICQSSLSKVVSWHDYLTNAPESQLVFTPVGFDHPLYIMYSSGTTGAPKCIVHSTGGTLLQHLKEHKLHTNVTRQVYYFTLQPWLDDVELAVSYLACGCTLVLYDGSPFARSGHILLDAIDEEKITIFGTSAKFIAAIEKQGLKPRNTHKLDSLKSILSTGSPLSETSFEYVYRDIKENVCLSSISGGTDIISCFMLGNPNLPVFSGEIQCLGLGMATEFWDESHQALVGTPENLSVLNLFRPYLLVFGMIPTMNNFSALTSTESGGMDS